MLTAVNSLQKLQREEERHIAAQTRAEEMESQLESYKDCLELAETRRAASLRYKTEVNVLKTQLSEKEQSLKDLCSELKQRERDIERLTGKRKVKESSPAETPPKIGSKSDFLLFSVQSYLRDPDMADTASVSGQPKPKVQAASRSTKSQNITPDYFLSVRSPTS